VTEEPTEPAKSGCGSTVAVGLVAMLALGGVLTLKKKED
jgi:LPXTG-motif cell wall-anchored protein